MISEELTYRLDLYEGPLDLLLSLIAKNKMDIRDIPIAEIYKQYSKTKPKKEVKPMGSMKHEPTADTGVKDFYSFEEAKQFTKADFDKNPALYEAVQKSMTKW